jgi:hypothetical protein
MTSPRENLVRADCEAARFGLVARDDGYYHVTEADGSIAAPNGMRVGTWENNDRVGEVGSPYPLTLDDIAAWLR